MDDDQNVDVQDTSVAAPAAQPNPVPEYSNPDPKEFEYNPSTKKFEWKIKERLLDTAEVVDAWRLVPRAILVAYGELVWHTVDWFMHLTNPNTQQSALVSTIVGAAAVVIGLYTNSGRKWGS